MLTQGMRETNEREIVLKDLADGLRKAVLDCMCTCKLEFTSEDDALEYFRCADRFQFEELEKVHQDTFNMS